MFRDLSIAAEVTPAGSLVPARHHSGICLLAGREGMPQDPHTPDWLARVPLHNTLLLSDETSASSRLFKGYLSMFEQEHGLKLPPMLLKFLQGSSPRL